MSDQIATIVRKAEQLARQGKFDEALSSLESGGDALETHQSALYIKAVCQRSKNDRNDALETLKKLLSINPDHVRSYQEIGHVHVAGKNADKAIHGYAEAVRRDPAMLSSWRPLVTLYRMVGDTNNQNLAEQKVRELETLPEQLVAVKSALNQNNLQSADQICRDFLKNNKQHVEALRLLAEIANRAKIIDDAEFFLESAVAFEPEHVGARFDLANILLKRQKFEAADKVAEDLGQNYPKNLEFKLLRGATRLGIGDTSGAISIYQDLVRQKHNLKNTYLLLGHAQKTAGNLAAATAAYQNLYRVNPDYGDAFWSLANTKTYRFTEDEISHMNRYVDIQSTSEIDKVHLHFALGKAYEDAADFDVAFSHYQKGNAINHGLLKNQFPDIGKRAERQKSVCTAELFRKRQSVGHPANDPIFIVGLPRAGSTLLEQILASHTLVDGTLELPNILSLARRLRGRAVPAEGEEPQYPKILTELDNDYFARFGEQFLQDVQIYRQEAPRFIDKMPNNFLHIGLIKLILPNARIIDARRHPMACCFSGFKQLFAEGQEFTYGLAQLGTYYRTYVDLMDHWEEVLPGSILRVQHEDVVGDLEGQVRRMLDFLDLPFEEACLEYHKTERIVRTPSSEQVRQPIYSSSLEQWRNFEKHLDPLIDALGPEIMQRYPIG